MQMEMEQLALTTDEWNIGSGDPMRISRKRTYCSSRYWWFYSQPSGNAGAR
jgi:hypothetical protein